MKSFSEYIKESYSFRLGGSQQKGYVEPREYKYAPKNELELRMLMKKLLSERGKRGDYNDIDVTNIDDFGRTFENFDKVSELYEFNGDISKWDVSQARFFGNMFRNMHSFNCDLSKWDTTSALNMSGMFSSAWNFNSVIKDWDVSRVVSMRNMFGNTRFNQDISDWDVRKVEDMTDMFKNAIVFNQPIGKWQTDSLKHISGMFCNAKKFNQDLSNWNVSNVDYISEDTFEDCPIKEEYKPRRK